MKKPIYKTRSKVWLYPGMAGWHFVSVSKKASKEIREKFAVDRRGFGSLPIIARVGKTSWKTSIFPDRKSGTYLLPIKAEVRKEEGITADKMLSFFIEVRV